MLPIGTDFHLYAIKGGYTLKINTTHPEWATFERATVIKNLMLPPHSAEGAVQAPGDVGLELRRELLRMGIPEKYVDPGEYPVILITDMSMEPKEDGFFFSSSGFRLSVQMRAFDSYELAQIPFPEEAKR